MHLNSLQPTAPWTVKARKILLLLFLVIAAIFAISPIHNQLRNPYGKDYPLWFNIGQRVVHGQSPYYQGTKGEFPFMYPPSAAGILAVGSLFGRMPLFVCMVLINSLAWFFCIVASVYLVSGDWFKRDPLLYWVPSAICIYYVWSTYLIGQPAVVLLACLLAMFVFLRKNMNWAAGAALAFAAGFKAFPILAVPYLIYRRYWKTLGFTAIFLFALLLILPAIFRGPVGAAFDLHLWSKGMLFHYDPETIAQRKDRSYTWQNGSLISVTNRLLRPVVADPDPPAPVMVNFANLSFPQINAVIILAALALCLTYLWVMPRQRNRTPWTDAVEAAMLLILIITFTPLSFTYNNSWLMLPVVVTIYFILVIARSPGERSIALTCLILSLLLLILTLPFPPFRILRAMGNTFWSCMILFALLTWIMRRSTQPAAPLVPTS